MALDTRSFSTGVHGGLYPTSQSLWVILPSDNPDLSERSPELLSIWLGFGDDAILARDKQRDTTYSEAEG